MRSEASQCTNRRDCARTDSSLAERVGEGQSRCLSASWQPLTASKFKQHVDAKTPASETRYGSVAVSFVGVSSGENGKPETRSVLAEAILPIQEQPSTLALVCSTIPPSSLDLCLLKHTATTRTMLASTRPWPSEVDIDALRASTSALEKKLLPRHPHGSKAQSREFANSC